jgi:hypothetical protein
MAFDTSRVPFGKIGLGFGALSVLGLPAMLAAMWNDVVRVAVGTSIYGAIVLLTCVSVIGAFSNRAKAQAAVQAAPPSQIVAREQAAAAASTDTKMAAAGAQLAVAGCGAMAVVIAIVTVVCLVVFAILVWWVGKYILGFHW